MSIEIMQRCIPEFMKKRKLKELFRLTADAFGCAPPEYRKLSFQEYLDEYALFTKNHAERCQEEATIKEVKHKLYQNSFLFGKDLQKSLMLWRRRDPVAALKMIYRLIGIDFEYDGQSEFIINHCFFSKYYTAEVCALISSLDEGLAAGLSNGGRLCFTQRITDGSGCCKGIVFQNEDIAGEQFVIL